MIDQWKGVFSRVAHSDPGLDRPLDLFQVGLTGVTWGSFFGTLFSWSSQSNLEAEEKVQVLSNDNSGELPMIPESSKCADCETLPPNLLD